MDWIVLFAVQGYFLQLEKIRKILDILRCKRTQKSIKSFVNEINSRAPKKNYPTNKTDVYHIDDIWSLDILDQNDYGPENNRAQ